MTRRRAFRDWLSAFGRAGRVAADTPDTLRDWQERIARKPFLRRIYGEWRARLAAQVPDGPGEVLEIGAAGVSARSAIPGLLCSDVLPVDDLDVVLDACRLPVRDASLRAIVMSNVLHHLPNPGAFLSDAARACRPGGRIVMIEPWVSSWSRLVYATVHHEPFDPTARSWELEDGHPLSESNNALAWIIFRRDRQRLEETCPTLRIHALEPFMPLRYLLSGGTGGPTLMPGWSFPFWTWIEALAGPITRRTALFCLIVLERPADLLPGGSGGSA